MSSPLPPFREYGFEHGVDSSFPCLAPNRVDSAACRIRRVMDQRFFDCAYEARTVRSNPEMPFPFIDAGDAGRHYGTGGGKILQKLQWMHAVAVWTYDMRHEADIQAR